MKYFAIVFFGVLVFAQTALAHSKRVPVISINGELAPLTNSANLRIDNAVMFIHDTDYAANSYSAGQQLKFELLRDQIRVIEDYIDSAEYIWDFGDGTGPQMTKGKLSATHTYKKPGGYIASMKVLYPSEVPDISGPIYIESVYLDITKKTETVALTPNPVSPPQINPLAPEQNSVAEIASLALSETDVESADKKIHPFWIALALSLGPAVWAVHKLNRNNS